MNTHVAKGQVAASGMREREREAHGEALVARALASGPRDHGAARRNRAGLGSQSPAWRHGRCRIPTYTAPTSLSPRTASKWQPRRSASKTSSSPASAIPTPPATAIQTCPCSSTTDDLVLPPLRVVEDEQHAGLVSECEELLKGLAALARFLQIAGDRDRLHEAGEPVLVAKPGRRLSGLGSRCPRSPAVAKQIAASNSMLNAATSNLRRSPSVDRPQPRAWRARCA